MNPTQKQFSLNRGASRKQFPISNGGDLHIPTAPTCGWFGQRTTKLERGARMVNAMITNTMLPKIGREFLSRLAAGSEMKRVHFSAKDGNFAFAFD